MKKKKIALLGISILLLLSTACSEKKNVKVNEKEETKQAALVETSVKKAKELTEYCKELHGAWDGVLPDGKAITLLFDANQKKCNAILTQMIFLANIIRYIMLISRMEIY